VAIVGVVLRRIVIAFCLVLAAFGATAASPAPLPTVPPFLASSIREFELNQSAPGAVTEVPDPVGGDEDVFKMTVSDDDVYPLTPTGDPRAELLSPATIQPGDQFWWRAKFLLPRGFPASVPGWLTLLEGPYGPPYAGTPPWHVEVHRNQIQWSRNRTYRWDVPWQMPLVRERWIEILVHSRLATHGFVEMWVDGERVTFFRGDAHNPDRRAPTRRLHMRTLDSTNDEGPNYVSVLNYRERGMFPSVTVYHGPMALGPTRASVTP
jgi:Polysaccharide lyase